jgi:ATP citrate (pro-S)-lyase
MSSKAIYERYGKSILFNKMKTLSPILAVTYNETTDWNDIVANNPWLIQKKLVVKPDQLIKRRGKLGLVGINLNLDQVKEWISSRMNKNIQVIHVYLKTIFESIYLECFHDYRSDLALAS